MGWGGSATAGWKKGRRLHAALVARPCSCIRRLAGTRAREIQFTRLLRTIP